MNFDGGVPSQITVTATTNLNSMRGTIALRNVAEGGCEFEVQLPRWRAEGPPGAAGAP
jgi:hypothetical protein